MGTETRAADTDRLVTVTLDPNTITSINPDEVHEWRIAIYDLLEDNSFRPAARNESPGNGSLDPKPAACGAMSAAFAKLKR